MVELDELRSRIEEHFGELTKSEKRIASYLLANHDEAAFLPAGELAARLNVSQATIIRFASAIGFKSFLQMRRCLQEIFRVQVTPATRLSRKLADFEHGKGDVLSQLVDMELQFLNEAAHSVKRVDMDRAVKLILGAERIFVFGLGPARLLADLAQLRLRRFGFSISALNVSGRDLLEELVLLTSKDVLLVTAFHRVTPELTAVLNRGHKVHCPAIMITDVLGPTYRDRADVILAARRGPISTFHSLTVPMTIVNALILAVAKAKPDQSVASLKALESLRAESGLDLLGKIHP